MARLGGPFAAADRGPYLTGPLARYALSGQWLTAPARAAADRAGLGTVCRNPFRSIVVRAVELLYAATEARRLVDEPITLEELADEFGVSRERVRQIEVRAFEKVQKAVKTRVAAMEAPQTAQALPVH